MLKPLLNGNTARLALLLLAGGLGLLGCGDPNVPLTQPPPNAFRVSTPRPPRLDLYPTPPPMPTPTSTPLPSLSEITARWLGLLWPPQRREISPVRLSAPFLDISLPPKPRPSPQPSPTPTGEEEKRQSHKT
jgi:hypothetical protein